MLDGRYEIVRLLGEGGMGVVYEARHVAIGTRLAIKILHSHIAETERGLTRLKREAQAASSIGDRHRQPFYEPWQ